MLARGAMEGVALSLARIAGQFASAAGPPQQVLASGRITRELPDLLQLLADVLGVPVTPVTGKRTTLRGTAIMALYVIAPGTVQGTTGNRPGPADPTLLTMPAMPSERRPTRPFMTRSLPRQPASHLVSPARPAARQPGSGRK